LVLWLLVEFLVLANSDDGDEPACWSLVVIWLSAGARGSAMLHECQATYLTFVSSPCAICCYAARRRLFLALSLGLWGWFTTCRVACRSLVGTTDRGKEVASTHALRERAGNGC